MIKQSILLIATTLTLAGIAFAQEDKDAQVVVINTDKLQFLYTDADGKKMDGFTVKAGKPVVIKFSNTSTGAPQPHNIIICKPGKDGAITQAAMAMMADPTALEKGYVPESDDIFAHSKLLQPGESEDMKFTVEEPGVYPYLCTFPGHFVLMKGTMTVE
ncbi:MAG: plastocyanin/azurin family copper-binding protein [Verrucomicrobiota bacterium]